MFCENILELSNQTQIFVIFSLLVSNFTHWGYVMVTNRFTKMPLLCIRMVKTSMKWQGKRSHSVKQPRLRLNVWLNSILNVHWPFFVPLCAIPCSVPLANCRLQTHKEHFQLGGESNREGKELIQLEQVTQLWRVLIIYLFPLCHISVRQHKFDYHLWLPEVMMGERNYTNLAVDTIFFNSSRHCCFSEACNRAHFTLNFPPVMFWLSERLHLSLNSTLWCAF